MLRPSRVRTRSPQGGLLQFGHSKDDPSRPQIKVMLGSLDPLGMPLSTDVLSGERADDGLYMAIMERIRTGLKTTGLLFVGDCKMSAFSPFAIQKVPKLNFQGGLSFGLTIL